MKTLKKLISLKKRTALITGGAGHLGLVMAETVAELGADVVLLDINTDQSVKKAHQIQKRFKVKVLPLAVDLTDDTAISTVPGVVAKEFGRLNILINCAALRSEQIQKRFKVKVLPLAVDLTDDTAISTVPGVVAKEFGRLNILINCAALV